MMALLSEFVWNKQSLAICGAFAVPLAVIISVAWLKINKIRYENELKRSMIERGMSADEIERVIAAGQKDE